MLPIMYQLSQLGHGDMSKSGQEPTKSNKEMKTKNPLKDVT